jgi:hypothetical protein
MTTEPSPLPADKDVAELVARYPRAGRLVALIKKVDAKARDELLSALGAVAADVLLRPPLREVPANGGAAAAAAAAGGAAADDGARTAGATFATPGPPAAANANDAAAAEAEAAAAFERSLVVLDGVTLQAPRTGKADLGFGAESLRIRTAKGGPMLTVSYADIEHVIVSCWCCYFV